MFNPLLGDLSTLKDADVEAKNTDLTKKYNMAIRMGNPMLAEQIVVILNAVKDELSRRHDESLRKLAAVHNKNVDELIKRG